MQDKCPVQGARTCRLFDISRWAGRVSHVLPDNSKKPTQKFDPPSCLHNVVSSFVVCATAALAAAGTAVGSLPGGGR